MNRKADLTIKLCQLKQNLERWHSINQQNEYMEKPITEKENNLFNAGYKKGMTNCTSEFIPQVEKILEEWSLWLGENHQKRTIGPE